MEFEYNKPIPPNVKDLTEENLTAIILQEEKGKEVLAAEVYILPNFNEPVTVIKKPGILSGLYKSIEKFGTKYIKPDDEY